MRTHERPDTPETDEPALSKRMKRNHISSASNPAVLADPTPHFATGVLSQASIHKLNAEYHAAEPYKYCRIERLVQDDLLKGVKDECLSELSFTEKETDIYKVNQTGDLASLSYLTDAQIALLPNLLTLRDALYSPKFRQFIQAVTGCGPLSGTKQDMSVNTYTKGCHLLNHDDVIGTRRVSYILYMPLPNYQGWQPEWGGALELYPVKPGPNGVPEPECIPSSCIPPSWNQFIFFEVQPGKSFHSVEEVVVGESEDGRQRLSVSGWFHAAQPGEEGYEMVAAPRDLKSSLEQLASTSTSFKSYPGVADPPLPTDPLSQEHIDFLSEFLNPVYLQPRTMATLASRFVEESSLELHSFLLAALAERLRLGLSAKDEQDGLGPGRTQRIPPHAAGTNANSETADHAWQLKGPPHKWRYCVLAPKGESGRAAAVVPRSADPSVDNIMRVLQDELFPSPAFRAFLAKVSSMLPLRWSAEARRFRPGLDYTLATSEESEARLDVVLGLTPEVEAKQDAQNEAITRRGGTAEPTGWQIGEWGGWECYMAPHEEDDDPAVYRSGSKKSKEPSPSARNTNESGRASRSPSAKGAGESMDTDASDQSDEDEDGTLLTVQPGFNRLLLVLRDERVMRFVKYVSAAAEGSRWDVCGEYEIGMVAEDS